jgi:hypothetical protein
VRNAVPTKQFDLGCTLNETKLPCAATVGPDVGREFVFFQSVVEKGIPLRAMQARLAQVTKSKLPTRCVRPVPRLNAQAVKDSRPQVRHHGFLLVIAGAEHAVVHQTRKAVGDGPRCDGRCIRKVVRG